MSKYFLYIINAFLFCLVISNHISHAEETTTEFRNLLDKIVQGRNKIKSAHVVFESHIETQDSSNDKSEKCEFSLFFQSEKKVHEKKGLNKHIFCFQNCYEKDTLMLCNLKPYYPLNSPDKKSDPYVVIHDFEGKEPLKNPFGSTADYHIPEIRVLGLVPRTTESLFFSVESYFIFERRTFGLPVKYEITDDDFLLKLSWSYDMPSKDNNSSAGQLVLNYWVDPSKDFIIRKADREYIYEKFKHSYTIHNEVTQDKKSGIWYPSSWVYEFHQNGELKEREECTLKAISINEPIDEKIFTLESIKDLKPGTYVHWLRKSDPPETLPLAWDGKKITGKGTVDFELATRGVAAAQKRKRMAFVFLVNGVLISAIVATLFYRSWRKQQG